MPTKPKGRPGWTPVVGFNEAILDAAAVARILDRPIRRTILAGGADDGLEHMARSYWAMRHADEGPSPAQQRALITELIACTEAYRTALEQLDSRAATALDRHGSDVRRAADNARRLLEDARCLDRTIRDGPAKRKQAVGTIMVKLHDYYENWSNQKFTCQFHNKGRGKGPVSDAACFVSRFFKEVDPRVTDSMMKHAMERIISQKKR